MKMNIDRKIQREKRNAVIRWVIYYLLAVIFYVVISTVRTALPMPLLLIPLAVGVAAFENLSPFYAALFGIVCGLLLDSATGTLVSFNGIIVGAAAMMTSLIFLFYFRRQLINFILLDLAAAVVQGLLHYLFFYLLWGYDPSHAIFREIFVPEFILTNLWGIAVYGLLRRTERIFGAVRAHSIEAAPSAK